MTHPDGAIRSDSAKKVVITCKGGVHTSIEKTFPGAVVCVRECKERKVNMMRWWWSCGEGPGTMMSGTPMRTTRCWIITPYPG